MTEITLRLRGRALVVRLAPEGDGWAAVIDGTSHRVHAVVAGGGAPVAGATVDELGLEIDGRRYHAVVARTRDRVQVALAGRVYEFETGDPAGGARAGGAGSGSVTAPMPGKIVAVLVRPGQMVDVGTPLVVLEAMKMESTLAAEVAGRVDAVPAVAGALVAAGDLLVEITPDAPA